MPQAIHFAAAVAAVPADTRHRCPKRHWCVFAPCGYYLGWAEPACPKHRMQLPLAVRGALKAAWDCGRGAATDGFAVALKTARDAIKAKEAGQS